MNPFIGLGIASFLVGYVAGCFKDDTSEIVDDIKQLTDSADSAVKTVSTSIAIIGAVKEITDNK